MKLNHRSLRRVLALALSLLLALTPTLSGGVLASGEPETPIVNEGPFIYNANGVLQEGATEIPEGGVKLTKTAAPVAGDPYSFDITLQVEAKGATAPAPKANIVLVLDRSSSMTEDVLTCTKTEHRHSAFCRTCGKNAHTHSGWILFGGCYSITDGLVCTEEEHQHSTACYCKTEEHRHGSGCYEQRNNVAIKAAKDMVSAFLTAGVSANFAVVSFGNTATKHQEELKALTSENQSTFNTAIDNALKTIYYDVGTNMEQGIDKATELLAEKTGEQNFIVVISDGEPTLYGTKPYGNGGSMDTATKKATTDAAAAAKSKGNTLYGVAFASDIEIMKTMFAPNYYTTANGAALDALLKSIATSITSSVKGSVSDTMGDMIDPDVTAVAGTSVENGVLSWNAGELTETQTITYRITLGDNYTGGLVDANKVATLTYNGTVTAAFPVPKVSAPLYKVTYQWAEDSDTPDSATLPTDSNVYRDGAAWTVADSFEPVLTHDDYDNVNGYYSFEGWDKTSGTIAGADVLVTGKWVYTDVPVPTHKVIYDWGAPDAAVTNKYTLPIDSNSYVNNQTYTVDDDTQYMDIEVKDELGGVTGKYTFSGWTDPNSGKMGESDVTITGEWSFRSSFTISYVVKYYVDSVSGTPRGTKDDFAQVYPNSDVSSILTDAVKNAYKPDNTDDLTYEDGVIDEASSTVITTDGQVINVVYKSKAAETTTEATTTSKATEEPTPTPTDSSTVATTTKATTTSVTTTEGASNEPPVTSTSEPPVATSEPATTTEPATSDSSDVSAVTTAPSEPSDSSTEAPAETTPDAPDAPIAPVDPDVPDTSDTNHTTLFTAMAVLSAMGLLVLLLNALNTRKSRKK